MLKEMIGSLELPIIVNSKKQYDRKNDLKTMVKVNFIASFLLAIVMLTSCSNVAKKSIEDLTVENIQGTLLHPDDKCIGAYPRLITQDFWLSQVYRDDVN